MYRHDIVQGLEGAAKGREDVNWRKGCSVSDHASPELTYRRDSAGAGIAAFAAFARYMAASAVRSRSYGRSASWLLTAIPMLADNRTSPSSIANGRLRSRLIRSAMVDASLASMTR